MLSLHTRLIAHMHKYQSNVPLSTLQLSEQDPDDIIRMIEEKNLEMFKLVISSSHDKPEDNGLVEDTTLFSLPMIHYDGKKISIQNLIDSYFSLTSETSHTPLALGFSTTSFKYNWIKNVPKYLIIKLPLLADAASVHVHGEGYRVRKHKLKIDVIIYVGKAVLKLRSIICRSHSLSSQTGHYYTVYHKGINNFNLLDEWICADDNTISSFHDFDLLTGISYVAIYKQIN